MCGIVGLFMKSPALEPELGRLLTRMLVQMTDRGPDSSGVAVYRPRAGAAGAAGNQRHMEIFKDVGLPAEVARKFGLAEKQGSHGLGHTRMATESAVTTAGSHPFTAGDDICLVHNGSLSNHNRLRRRLERAGQTFETWNDTEVAARYFAHRLGQGAGLAQAIETAFDDLDGFYTFAIGTRDGFAVVRDGFACKPAVLAETDDWVAMASEYRAIADLPEAGHAEIWEPKPERIYTWHLDGHLDGRLDGGRA